MTNKDIVITCVWTTDGFVLLDKKNRPTDDEAVLKIDEGTETISVSIPTELSLITKKIIERRVQSIAKSGFAVPSSSLRIGGGFKVEINKTDEIPEVLLQEGHKYTFGDITSREKALKKQELRPKLPSEMEDDYIPSFLIHDPNEQDHLQISQVVKEMESPDETAAITFDSTVSSVPDDSVRMEIPSDSLAGNFIIALSEIGDIYLTRQEDSFTVEFARGRIDFEVQNGEIVIQSTERVAEDDDFIISAIKKAEG
jgi:hypothetical protein